MKPKPSWQSRKTDPMTREQDTQNKSQTISAWWHQFRHPLQTPSHQNWQVQNWNLSIFWQEIITL